MNQKELNIYFRKIRLLLPIYSKAEKQFLKDFKDSVFVFIEQNPLCTMDDVIERFSTPEEVVHDYISEALATENLCQKIQFRRLRIHHAEPRHCISRLWHYGNCYADWNSHPFSAHLADGISPFLA